MRGARGKEKRERRFHRPGWPSGCDLRFSSDGLWFDSRSMQLIFCEQISNFKSQYKVLPNHARWRFLFSAYHQSETERIAMNKTIIIVYVFEQTTTKIKLETTNYKQLTDRNSCHCPPTSRWWPWRCRRSRSATRRRSGREGRLEIKRIN